MARVVREIMNPEVTTFPLTAPTDEVLEALLELGISAAPVVDDERRPVGVTSVRDLVRMGGVQPPVSAPARSVDASTNVEDAARLMAESGLHHLVVVGSDGRVVGMVSSADLLRALVGLPPKFPATYPHRDAELGVSWTDIVPFDIEHRDEAIAAGGVLVLSVGGVGKSEQVVWAEAAPSLRARVTELLELPYEGEPELAHLLEREDLRFRCARVDALRARVRIVRWFRARIDRAALPLPCAAALSRG